jgi:O-antigen ligase
MASRSNFWLAMVFKRWWAPAWTVLPWLIGATQGPLAQMGAWLAAASVIAGLLMLHSTARSASSNFSFSLGASFVLHSWPFGLLLASSLSLGMAGVQYSGWTGVLSSWMASVGPGEMLANLRQRNQFASLMALGFLAALAWVAWKANSREGHDVGAATVAGAPVKLPRLLFGLCLLVALLGFGNALSGSRTGLLQWLAVLGLMLIWRRSLILGWRWIAGAATLGYVLGVIAAPWMAELLGHANAGLLGRAQDSNAFSRIALWSNVWELVLQKPLQGWGAGALAYAHYSTSFSGTRFMEMLDNAHNLPLHMAFVFGLPATAFFCSTAAWLGWKNQPWRETRPDRQLAWGCLLVIGIHSMLEYPLWYGPFFMTAVICVAVLCKDVWQKWLLARTESARAAIILGAKWVSRSIGVVLVLATAFVAFDYHKVSQMYLQPEERSAWYPQPMAAAKSSVFFRSHAKFAELQITPLTRETAPRVLELSSDLVEWSPEPRIIEKLIESATMMELDELAAFHLRRYKTAYPAAFANWQAAWLKTDSARSPN